MSGDVQPRKRKDKKKRKDGDDEPQHHSPRSSVSIADNDDVNIHVHKDSSTGGGLCAKFVFFILLTALAVLIGLIVTEHRGLTHLDTIEKENRFSQLFEGWVDTTPDDHDDHHVEHLSEELEQHDESDHAEDDHDVSEHEEDDHDEEDDHAEEDEHEDEDVSEQAQSVEVDEDDDKVNDLTEEDDDKVNDLTEEDEDDKVNDVTEEDEDNDDDDEDTGEQDDEVENASDANNEDDVDDDVSEPKSEEPASVERGDSEEMQRDEIQKEPEENEEDEIQDVDEETVVKIEEPSEEVPDNDDQSIGGNQASGEQVVDYINEWEVEPNSYNYEENNENREDDVEDQLTEAENNAALALNTFNQILTKYPKSVRGLYGKAQCLDRLADQKRSNSLLIEAIQAYWEVLELKTVPENVFVAAGERSINRMRFIGQYGRAVDVHKLFIEKYPRNVTFRNQLAVTYLTVNKIKESRDLLEETLKQWPDNGFALVHYGFILKVNDNNLGDSIEYLRRGIRTKEPGVVDGRFYFHLGDALARSHRAEEADRVYEEGVRMGVFLSKYQRSLYNVNKLTARPWWTKQQLKVYQQFLNHLEDHHRAIRNEGLAVLNAKGHFQDEAENLRDSGDWKQFELYARGQKNKANCDKCPFTCKLMESLSDAVGCRRGQIKFSVMHPGTHVWPHCGPTNCRLRIHLGLKVPANTYIRVADETKTWREGKVLIFDDSFEHEVWHNGSDFRLVLIVDVWHPELSPMEKRSLSAI